MKLLGITFNCKFNFDDHINNVVVNCTRKLFALRVIRPFTSSVNCTRVYEGLIRSIIEYCSPLFVSLNCKNSKKLNKIHNRAHKIVCGSANCNLFSPLHDRRIAAAVKLFNRIANDPEHLLYPLLPKRSILPNRTGNSHRFVQPTSHTSLRSLSYFPYITGIVNLDL